MPFKVILAVTGPDVPDPRLDLAVSLCQDAEAHLAVLATAVAAPPPIGRYAAEISDAWHEERRAEIANLQKFAAELREKLAQKDVSSDISTIYEEEGWVDDVIGQRAKYTDLVLLGPDLLAHPPMKEKVVEGALFRAGKPLLVIPEGARPTLKPKRILVAWNARIEASKAVSTAIELLAGAESVHVALVDPEQGERDHGFEPGADIATYLAKHGAKVTVDRLPSQGRPVEDILRQHAVDVAADMLVMGAYGHSRMRQRIFGGVTRSMLDNPPLPVFLAR